MASVLRAREASASICCRLGQFGGFTVRAAFPPDPCGVAEVQGRSEQAPVIIYSADVRTRLL